MKKLILIGLLILTAWMIDSAIYDADLAHAGEIAEEQAIRAILGEARGEGELGMYAVACAIRNRGSLRGVYGAKAKIPDLTPELWQKASKAWFTSLEGTDMTGGATHWEAVQTFGKPYWADSMVRTVKIGNHTFYREVA